MKLPVGMTCKKCGKRKTTTAFPLCYWKGKRVGATSYRRHTCRQCCSSVGNVKYRETRRQYQAAYALRKHYDLTPTEYGCMVKRQRGRCAACSQPESLVRKTDGKVYSLQVDHDHKTGRIRGLLCCRCNRTLGQVDDSIQRLELLIAYLRRQQ